VSARRRRISGAVALALTAAIPGVAVDAALAATAPLTARARLHGVFALAGRVTAADAIPGEQAGQQLYRTWAFTSACASGQCAAVALVRQRGTTADKLTLRRQQPGYYVGSGAFYAPLRCGAVTWARGARVGFTIAVRVTAAVSGRAVIATRVNATYTNTSRTNLTPCVGALGRDAASYHGHLVGPVYGAGGVPGAGSGGAGTGP
jgi:hypothetical protein